jgi:23S rRNA (uracil1939-C5)-methyltransferase
MSDDLYRTWKSSLLEQALAMGGLSIRPDPMLSVPLGSRRRATFGGVWEDGRVELGFHGPSSHTLERITACAVLLPEIVDALPVLEAIAQRVSARSTAPRVTVLAADNGLDVAIEGRALAAGKIDLAEIAKTARRARIVRITVGGAPFLMLEPPVVRFGGVDVSPPPGAFLQATRATDEVLAGLVMTGIGKARRVADLFAGLGTLSLPMASQARVLAVDSDPDLLKALGDGVARAQGLKPVDRLRRDLFRDPLSPRELDAFDAVVLDPPRAGASTQSAALVRSKVKRVVMVSCNPGTLQRDLATLVGGGFRLERAVAIDQFLFTPHLEAVAVLSRR